MASGVAASRVRVDIADECIWRDGERLGVPPKAFLVLRCLMAQPSQLVTKQQLMEAAWSGTAVAEVALNVAIRQLREALADDSKAPRFIETVHRRGFRWIGPRPAEASTPEECSGQDATPTCVGRAAALDELTKCLARAASAQRQLVFVTGDTGIGKTTVVDHFLSASADALVARGQCTAAGEPYRPMLEAIETLLRLGGSSMRTVFARHAPTWMLQMPGLFTVVELKELRRRVTTSTGDHMQRELERAIEAASAERSIVLVLEDLHWSDSATVALLWSMAARREAARLLVIGTYRPVDAIAERHPIVQMKRELASKKQCVEVALEGLDAEAIGIYLGLRFSGHRLPTNLAARLQAQTSGNPLFLVNALADFEERGWLSRHEGAWMCSVDLDTLDSALPDGTRALISWRLDQLPAGTREMLEAASAAGETFATQTVAAATERSCDEVEDEFARLARGAMFLRGGSDVEWPDGSHGGQHSFRHALYRQVLQTRLTPTRRRMFHERIAARLEGGYGDRTSEIAAQLRFHWEQAGNLTRAVDYIDVLVPQAYERHATREAEALTEHAVALLKRLPPSDARQQRLLKATIAYGMALGASRGALSVDAGRVFADARELGKSIPTSPEYVTSLVGQAVGALMSGRVQESHRIGEELLALAEPDASPHAAISANLAVGNARLHLGEIEAAIACLKRGVALLEKEPIAVSDASYGAAVGTRAALGTALIAAGQVESGWASILAAVDLAKASGAPWYHGFALSTLSSAAIFRRVPAEARQFSAELLAYCEAHGVPYWSAAQRVYFAWAEVVETRDPARVEALVRAVDGARGIARLGWPRVVGVLADAYLCLGRLDDASRALDEAFDPEWEERLYYAELWRLRAAVVLARPTNGKRSSATQRDEAEQILLRALEIANTQGARLFGLRITVDLCRLWQARGEGDLARQQLSQAIGEVDRGAGVDLRAAQELLIQLTA